MLTAAYYLTAAQLPLPALGLAQAVVEVLGDSEQPDEARSAAIGQVWVVIDTMYGGQTTPGTTPPDDLGELPNMSLEELRSFSPVIGEAEKLQARGMDAVRATDVVFDRLKRTGQWDRAFITILGVKVEALQELDQPETLRAAMQQFIDVCSGIERWNAPALVQEYRDRLARD